MGAQTPGGPSIELGVPPKLPEAAPREPLTCQSCGHPVDDAQVGTTVACSRCGTYIHVPIPTGPGCPQIMGEQQVLLPVKDADAFDGLQEVVLRRSERAGVLFHVAAAPKRHDSEEEATEPYSGADLLFAHSDPSIVYSTVQPFVLHLRRGALPSTQSGMQAQPLVLSMSKPQTTGWRTCGCCCWRPQFEWLTDAAQHNLGHVASPCLCCRLGQLLYPASSPEPDMTAGPLWSCDPGLVCPTCFDAEVPVYRDGRLVASLTRPALTCEQVCGGGGGVLKIDFRALADTRDRLRVFAAALLLHLDLFYSHGL
eukprot:TRINITY_DN45261_c0_g1_i1.p1 TRINITY_DN45261_c0_g1~~TRINITY_DN45261_c0_g1_i1.p1  ORF type:complete len:311 (+),score=45.20 TRINITY_DN45261_c0_g1_i1:62-994(+)